MKITNYNILLFILSICLSITCNACGCFPKSGTFTDDDKKDWTLKLERVTPEKISRKIVTIAGDSYDVGSFEFTLLKEGPQRCECDIKKVTIKVSTINNETSDKEVKGVKYANDVNFVNGMEEITDSTFASRYMHHESSIVLGLVDMRDLLNHTKQVTINLELLYDGKPLDNPDSKLSFYWENPSTP